MTFSSTLLFFCVFCVALLKSVENGWKQVNPHASFSDRTSPHGVNVNGTFILTGGRNGTETMHNDVWITYNQGVSWEIVIEHANWDPRAYHFCVYLNDSLFVIGGQGGDGLSEFFDDIWRSDDFGKTWTNVVEHAPFGKRAGGYGFVYNNEIYILGGAYCDPIDVPCNIDGKRHYFDDVWKSKNGIDWIQISTGNECMKREGMIVVIKDDTFYLFGGDNGFAGPYFNDVWKSDDNGVTWSQITQHAEWSARTGQVGVLYGNYITMFGGYPDLTDMWRSLDGITWEFVSNNSWNCDPSQNYCGKFDFEFLVDYTDGIQKIYTIAGDQEVTLPIPQDNDVWYYYNDSFTN